MNRNGEWSLAPAYDMTFSFRPNSHWTSMHQMKINGKNKGLTIKDLMDSGKRMDISERKAKNIIELIMKVVSEWPQYAENLSVKSHQPF